MKRSLIAMAASLAIPLALMMPIAAHADGVDGSTGSDDGLGYDLSFARYGDGIYSLETIYNPDTGEFTQTTSYVEPASENDMQMMPDNGTPPDSGGDTIDGNSPNYDGYSGCAYGDYYPC